MQRRDFLKTSLAAGAVTLMPSVDKPTETSPQGTVKHSVSKWCYPDLSVEELARAVKPMGIASIELLDPPDWPILQRHGLVCAMSRGPKSATIPKGFNRVAHHEWLVPDYEAHLRKAAEAGVPNVICFSGKRKGLSDEEGLKNCAQGLRQIMPTAEKLGVTVCMELLNSKRTHPDYQCDHTAWGVELAHRVDSGRFKLLYDIFHMQIMEGDVIRTIRDNHRYIAHYHTGGVPGRHEIDETQELNYPAIVRAIEETGYEGFLGQEFVPTGGDPLASLEEAVRICRV